MSKTITLVVGERKRQYVIHKSLLGRSPVLAKMSEGDFLESSEVSKFPSVPSVFSESLSSDYPL